MKNKLRKMLLAFSFGLLFASTSCELQEDVIEKHNYEHKVMLTSKSFSELSSDSNFMKSYGKIPTKKVLLNSISKSNSVTRTKIEEDYEFTIFDAPIKVYESDTLITYNLLIKSDTVEEGNYFENLIINNYTAKNVTDIYKIKYFYDEGVDLVEEYLIKDPIKIILTPIYFNNHPFDDNDRMSMICIRYLGYQCCYDPNGNLGGCHWPIAGECDMDAVQNFAWVTVDVVCNTDSGSGGYDYSGVGGGPKDPHQGGSNGNGNHYPVYSNPTPPCDPRVDCPVLEDASLGHTPCDELNKLTKNPTYPTNPYMDSQDVRIRTAVINMSNNVNPSGEGGYGFYNQGNYSLYGPYANYTPSTANNHVNFPPRGYQFGTIHTHPNDGIHIPMFSHDDIYSLYKIRENYALNAFNTSGDNLFVCVMTVKIGDDYFTYAIKIEDFTKLQTLQAIHNSEDKNDWKKYGETLEKQYVKRANGANGTKTQYERTFLQFLKEQDLGVTLYEMEQFNVGTPNVQEKWKKLELAADNTNIDEIPCN